MIVCHSFFSKNSLPKYLDKAVDLMRKANHNAFATPDDWQSFLKVLRRSLEEVNGAARGWQIYLGSGQLSINKKMSEDYAARLSYFTLKDLLMWNEVIGDFFGRADREGGAL